MALAQGRSGVLGGGGGDENARSYFREVTPPTRDFPRPKASRFLDFRK